MSVDIDLLCRVCLIPNPPFAYNIFTSVSGKRNALLVDMFSICTKIQPQMEDGLPKRICKSCHRQLKRSFTFSKTCETSEKKLRKLLAECYAERDANTQENKVKIEIDVAETGATNGADLFETEDCVKNEIDQVKSELNNCKVELDDDLWDAEDDNMVLHVIKSRKSIDVENGQPEIAEKKHKKKGRKKKEVLPCNETDPKMPHQCDVCGKLLSTKSNLKAHKICHTDQRPYTCSDCPASFRGYSALFQHRKVHTGETPYHCEYCPKQFSRRTGLINHIRVHTGEKLFSCDICFKNFTQSAQLSIHMKRHKGDKPYLCQECGKGFPIRSDLKVHQRIHNGEKPYSCHLCPKTFATSGNLSIHIRIHNKEVRYQCKECSRGFVTCSSFNLHVKRHKGQKDHQCECGKTFYTLSALKQHKVVHTGEKKYQCKICERKFTQTGHLSRHFKKDHGKPSAPNAFNQCKLVIPAQPDKLLRPVASGAGQVRNLCLSVKCEAS